MRRRSSGSSIEGSDQDSSDVEIKLPVEGKEGFSSGHVKGSQPALAEGQTFPDGASHNSLGTAALSDSTLWERPSPVTTVDEADIHLVIPLNRGYGNDKMPGSGARQLRVRSPWALSLLTLVTTVVSLVFLLTILRSFFSRQLDPKGCAMSYMNPAFAKLADFDTEHTRFASKYSLYLYREGHIDEDTKVKGVPVLFIPGNAGSYKQVRPLGAEGAQFYHDVVQHDSKALQAGTRSLDFFTVDFNEDITAFHGQTLLDQAEFLNEAVAYILSLYHDPRRATRDSDLPDPSSVILVGHSMGGIVARTMLVMPNYQANSINTIITMSAPHARPPVSFDATIVHTYKRINDYWREAYQQKWANNNPLWHVTLISIAGGGLDTVVPSDYASLSSLVPETHGFTVFTSTIPDVWTGMDHLSILWCDQFRKVIVRALIDIVDVKRPSQTKPRAERMRIFKKWFLTGMEDVAEKTLPQKEPNTLLTLEDDSNDIISPGKRLTLRKLGTSQKPQPYLLPVPPQGSPVGKRFTLLTDQKLDAPDDSGSLEVLFCSVFPLQSGQTATLFSMNMDLSGDSTGSTRLACKNAAEDASHLPASTRQSRYPFDQAPPFTYLQYDLEDLGEHQFVAIVDKANSPTAGWVNAEFADKASSSIRMNVGLTQLLTSGLSFKLPPNRPMVTEMSIPALHSSLLAYHLTLSSQACGEDVEMFTPLLRQYVSDPYESKFFVNVKEANVNLHGIAPFMPPPLRSKSAAEGLSLQLFSDPTCNTSVDLTLEVDILGSLGKLVMRYRTVFAAFPLLVVALVLRKQFQVFDQTGIFMSFSESIHLCLRSSLPILLLALSFLAMSLARASSLPSKPGSGGLLFRWGGNATESAIDFTKNDLLLGQQDPFFWFLVPLLGLLSVGVCVLTNYVALMVVSIIAAVYSFTPTRIQVFRKRKKVAQGFAPATPRRRVLTTSVLLLLVSTFIPYQFAYLVACVVQIATCVRALAYTKDSRSVSRFNFYNYTHSVLVLMLWILPINIPVLVVWIHNLNVHWLTPFSSHHNVLSIMPFIVLVETLTSGKMVPRMTSRLHHVTSILFFSLALFAAVYGVTYAYMLHHLVNIGAAWLAALHLSTSEISLSSLTHMLEGEEESGIVKKTP